MSSPSKKTKARRKEEENAHLSYVNVTKNYAETNTKDVNREDNAGLVRYVQCALNFNHILVAVSIMHECENALRFGRVLV